jgi:hypothetical protein
MIALRNRHWPISRSAAIIRGRSLLLSMSMGAFGHRVVDEPLHEGTGVGPIVDLALR